MDESKQEPEAPSKQTSEKEVSSVGVQEPSDGVAVEEGVVTESPCDAVATQEIPPSTCNASAASELLMAARGSCEDKTNLPVERVSALEALVHEPAKSFTDGGTTNIDASEIDASIHDVSAASAVRESSEVKASFSNKSLRSRKRERSSDNSMGSRAHLSRYCSEIWEPLRKSRRFSDNTANLCERETSDPDEVNATDETVSTDKCEIIVSRANVIEDSELVVAMQESPKENISPMVEVVFSLDVHEPVKAMALRENIRDNITLPMEMVFSPAGHQLARGEAAEETIAINEIEITTPTCSATEASELVMAMEGSSEDNATLSVETRPSLDLRELSEGVDRDKTTVIDASEITSSTCNVTVASELATAEEVTIALPLEKSSSLDVLESSEVLPTQESTNLYEGEITPSSHNVIAGQDLCIAVDEYLEGNTTLSEEKVSIVDEADQSEALTTDGTTRKDESEMAASINNVRADPQVLFAVVGSAEGITLPVEKASSLDVLRPAEAIATDETPLTDEDGITSSIHGFSRASELLMVGKKDEEGTTMTNESEITASMNDFSAALASKKPSEDEIIASLSKSSSLDVHDSAEGLGTEEIKKTEGSEINGSTCIVNMTSEPLMGVQTFSEDNINLPAERVSSLSVHESAESFTEDRTNNINASEIDASIPDASAALAVRESSEVEGSFSNKSLRSRKRERSSDNSMGRYCSEICEPLRKSRRFSDNTANLCQRETSDPDKVNATDETISTDRCESIVSRANVIADSELVMAMQESPKDKISPMVEEVFSLDVHEPVKAVVVRKNSKDDITLPTEVVLSLPGHEVAKTEAAEGANDIDECEIAASRCTELVTAMEFSEDNATLSVEKNPSLDLHALTEGVAGEETTAIYESGVTSSTCNVTAASELVMAEEKSSEDNARVPMKKHSYLDLRELSKGVDIDDTTVIDASDIITPTCNITAVNRFAAFACDATQAVQEHFQDNTTLPVEKIVPLEVHKPTKAFATEETTNFDDSEIAASTCDGTLAVQGHFEDEITLPVEKVSSIDVHEPVKDVVTKETTTSNDMERSLSSGSSRPRKRKRGAETAIEGSGHASTSCSVHENDLEPVRKSKHCMLNSGAETAASSPKATIAPAVLCEGAEAAAIETANVDTIKIKTEGNPAPNSGAETPDTVGYVYYMSTAYQLLCGAMQQDSAAIPLLESANQQPQEATAAEPSQTTRARRRRVRRVWNGEAFVPEGQRQEHAEAISVGDDHGETKTHL